MNKHALIIFTTTIIFSTTCMKRDKSAYTLNLQTTSPDIIVAYPLEVYPPEECIKVNEPIWTLSNQTTTQELVPIYKPVSTVSYSDRIASTIRSITQPESYFAKATKDMQTPLLHTYSSVQNNNNYLKERLYNSACELVDYITPDKNGSYTYRNVITQNKKMITVIELMNEAKKKCLTEDFMGNFAYKKYCSNGLNENAPFVFACLKKYMLTVRDSEEKIPFSTDDFYTNNDLTQTLKITCKKNITEEQLNDLAPSYPAYNDLITNIKKIIDYGLADYIPDIYSSTQILSYNYPEYSHITNLHECFDALISIFLSKLLYCESEYNALNLIEQIKKFKNIKQEKDLGSNILVLEKQQTFKEKMLNCPKTEYPIRHKNIAAIFCILVEEYNKARGKKITPNPIQSMIYYLRLCGIALPDSFNTNLLDENSYALKEFFQLKYDTQKLRSTNDSDLQDLVDRYYIFDEKEQG